MSGKKIVLLAVIFVSLMAAFSIVIITSASGDNINNTNAQAKVINPANLSKVTVAVEGMTCTACEPTIQNMVKKVAGVVSATSSFADKSTIVEFDTTQTNINEIVKAIAETGYKATAYEDKHGKHSLSTEKTALKKVESTMKCGAGKCGGAAN